MRVFVLSLLLIAVPSFALAGIAAAPKKIYCWDENGQRKCGDVLPASAASAARTEMSAKTGNVTKTVDRAPTAEEIAAQQAAAQAQQAQDAVVQQQKHRVDLLLASYPSEDELLNAFKEREDELNGIIQSMQFAQKPLHESMLTKLRQLGDLELANRPLPPKQIEQFNAARKQYLDSSAAIAAAQQKLVQLEKDKANTLALYRAAKAPPAPAAPDPQG